MRPELQKHYGADVWTNPYTDYIRREECLCLNCNCLDWCPAAKQLYELCKGYDLALMMTRCKSWEEKSNGTH
jgi:hypothetical protein